MSWRTFEKGYETQQNERTFEKVRRDPRSGCRRLTEKRLRDRKPLLIERTLGRRFAGSPIPVPRVSPIAFFAVEVGVNPRSRWTLVPLRRFMCLLPVAFRVPPQT